MDFANLQLRHWEILLSPEVFKYGSVWWTPIFELIPQEDALEQEFSSMNALMSHLEILLTKVWAES